MDRISFIASLTKGLKSVVDCGIDHGYTLISAIRDYGVSFGYGIDVNKDPLEAARINIEKAGLTDKTKLILSDGLQDLEENMKEQPEGLIITGMGGSLITEILSYDLDLSKSFKRLILSAHNDTPKLRYFLINRGFKITEEYMLEENNHIYEVIVATTEPLTKKYDYYDMVFGPILRKEKSQLFIKKYTQTLNQTKIALENAKDEVQISKLKMTKAMIEEVLK